MITVASFPGDLGAWNQDEHPYYLEVFGEAAPALDMAHAEVIPAGGSDAATTNPTPIYEYWWTIGHGGSKPEHRHLFEAEEARPLASTRRRGGARLSVLPDLGRQACAGARGEREVPQSGPATVGLDRQGGAGLAAHAADPRGRRTGRLHTRGGAGLGNGRGGRRPDTLGSREAAGRNRPSRVKGFHWYVEKVTVPPCALTWRDAGSRLGDPEGDVRASRRRLTGSLAVSLIPTARVSDEPWQPQRCRCLPTPWYMPTASPPGFPPRTSSWSCCCHPGLRKQGARPYGRGAR